MVYSAVAVIVIVRIGGCSVGGQKSTRAVADTCPLFNLGQALPVSVTGSTAAASNAMGGSLCGDGGINAPDVTYQWTAPADGTYAISTFASAFNTILTVLEGGCTGSELACNDDSSNTTQCSAPPRGRLHPGDVGRKSRICSPRLARGAPVTDSDHGSRSSGDQCWSSSRRRAWVTPYRTVCRDTPKAVATWVGDRA